MRLWQIVLVTDLNSDFDDLDDSEIQELLGTNNEIVEADDIALVAAYIQTQLTTSSEEHREQFFDEEAPIEYVTEINEAGHMTITSKIDGQRYAEATIYPVTIIKLPIA